MAIWRALWEGRVRFWSRAMRGEHPPVRGTFGNSCESPNTCTHTRQARCAFSFHQVPCPFAVPVSVHVAGCLIGRVLAMRIRAHSQLLYSKHERAIAAPGGQGLASRCVRIFVELKLVLSSEFHYINSGPDALRLRWRQGVGVLN